MKSFKPKRAISRRIFLHGSAQAAFAAGFPHIVPSSVLGRGPVLAPSQRIAVGCIGVGSHGVGVNLKNYLVQKDARVVALCDVDAKRLENARKIVNQKYNNQDCAIHRDWREVIARPDIDAVMISTPDHWHVPISLAAIHAGKDVQCEKPTLTIAEGRTLADTVKRYGAVFQTSTEDRSVAVYHRMAELVRNGRIGKLQTIRVELPTGNQIHGGYKGELRPEPVPEWFDYQMWLGPAPNAPYQAARCHWNFRWIRDYSGGMLSDWGAHLFDTAQWANDTEHSGPVQIEGKGVFPKDGLYDTAEKFHIEYQYAKGVRLFADSGIPSIRFEGTEGWVGNRGWRAPIEASSPKILRSVIGPEETHLFTCPGGEHRNFLDCVKTRAIPYFSAEIGHRVSTICHLGNISMLLGKNLNWDPEREEFPNNPSANRYRSRAMRDPWRI